MKGSTVLLIGAGIVAAVLLARKAAALANLNFVPRGVSINGGTIQVMVGVQNPTSGAITLNSLSGNIMVNGSNAGNVSTFTPVLIAANAETTVNLSITPSIFGLASQAVNFLENGESSYQVSLQGTANVNDAPFPVNVNF